MTTKHVGLSAVTFAALFSLFAPGMAHAAELSDFAATWAGTYYVNGNPTPVTRSHIWLWVGDRGTLKGQWDGYSVQRAEHNGNVVKLTLYPSPDGRPAPKGLDHYDVYLTLQNGTLSVKYQAYSPENQPVGVGGTGTFQWEAP